MSNSLPYLFWIDHAKPRLKLVELVFLDVSWTKIYTISNLEDFIFRFEDLAPWGVVIDEQQFPMENELLKNYFYQNKIRIIHLAEANEVLNFSALSIGRISRTLNPMILAESIYEFYLKVAGSGNSH